MDRIAKQIENGPGELDIIIDVLRRFTHVHPYFTFSGVRVPVHITNVGEPVNPEGERMVPGEWVALQGVVLLHERNKHRYHGFAAMYNVRTRQGTVEFETNCRNCGSEVNEFGLCVSCDPCPRCDRKECQPHYSCMTPVCGACAKPATLKGEDGAVMCENCANEHGGTFVAL
jgi:hypothetical protein